MEENAHCPRPEKLSSLAFLPFNEFIVCAPRFGGQSTWVQTDRAARSSAKLGRNQQMDESLMSTGTQDGQRCPPSQKQVKTVKIIGCFLPQLFEKATFLFQA